MKTIFLNLAIGLFAIASLSSVALADPAASQAISRYLSKPSSSTHTQFVLNERCKADSCCAKKTVPNGFAGGRAAQPGFKTVVTCDKKCTLPTANQVSVCRKGLHA